MVENLSYDKLLQTFNRLLEDYNKLKEENTLLKELLSELGIKLEQKKQPSFVKPNKKGRRKKPGRKPGHKGVGRKIPDKVDRVKTIRLDECPDCDCKLSDTKEVRSRYVTDIKKVRVVTRYDKITGYCKKCKKKVYPELKGVLPRRRLGKNFTINAAQQKYATQTPLLKIKEDLEDYGLNVSHSTIFNHVSFVAGLFEDEYQAMRNKVSSNYTVYIDETGHRENGSNMWLWTFTTPTEVFFKIDKRRSGKVVDEQIGIRNDRIIVSDFFPAYNQREGKKQKCNAHLGRDISKIMKKKTDTDEELTFCKTLKRILKDAKRLKGRDTPLEIARWRKHLLIKRIDKLAIQSYKSEQCSTLAERTFRHKDELFTFLEHDVDDNNNRAERSLRHGVIMMKISFGTRSERGTHVHEVMLTIYQTCKLREESFVEHVRDAINNFH